MKLYDFPVTWVEQTLNAHCIRYIRNWLEMPISVCVKETLPGNRCGLGISSFKHLAEKMVILKRHALHSSSSSDMRQVWKDSMVHHVVTDEFFISNTSCVTASKLLLHSSNLVETAQIKHSSPAYLHGLQLHGITTKTIVETVSKENISIWSMSIEHTSAVLHNFARKAMLQMLPAASNLVRWKRLTDPSCSLCKCGWAQRNKHVLSNCGSPTALHRYTSRHNDVLRLLINWCQSVVPSTHSIYTDSSDDSAVPLCDLFHNYRPNVAVVMDSELHTWELTICHETKLN